LSTLTGQCGIRNSTINLNVLLLPPGRSSSAKRQSLRHPGHPVQSLFSSAQCWRSQPLFVLDHISLRSAHLLESFPVFKEKTPALTVCLAGLPWGVLIGHWLVNAPQVWSLTQPKSLISLTWARCGCLKWPSTTHTHLFKAALNYFHIFFKVMSGQTDTLYVDGTPNVTPLQMCSR
jgi:hypothetical protein